MGLDTVPRGMSMESMASNKKSSGSMAADADADDPAVTDLARGQPRRRTEQHRLRIPRRERISDPLISLSIADEGNFFELEDDS